MMFYSEKKNHIQILVFYESLEEIKESQKLAEVVKDELIENTFDTADYNKYQSRKQGEEDNIEL